VAVHNLRSFKNALVFGVVVIRLYQFLFVFVPSQAVKAAVPLVRGPLLVFRPLVPAVILVYIVSALVWKAYRFVR